MQTATINNLFLTDHSSFKVLAGLQTASRQGAFYQQIANELIKGVYTKEVINRLGDKLTTLAHHAYTIRWMDAVDQVSHMLMNLPMPREYRRIGRYYHSFNLRREGQVVEARSLLEKIEIEVPWWYRGRIIMSLAGLEFDNSDPQSALPLYIEAGRAASQRHQRDLFTTVHTQKMIAVLKGINGDNLGALADLERLLPLARLAGSLYPPLYYDFLNSLAVEMMEVGRLEEAQNVSRIVLVSPYVSAYPEWVETGKESEIKSYKASRSFVATGSALPTTKIVSDDLFSTETIADADRTPEPAAIEPPSCAPINASTEPESDHRTETAGLILFPHKLQSVPPPTNPDAITPDELAQMTTAQKRGMLSALIHDHNTPDQHYDKMLDAVGLVKTDQGPNEIDLESDSYLSRLVIHWCGAIDCEWIVPVMSALRDCQDDLRRNNIINRFISFAFRESLQHSESEDEWRKRVEARLKPLPTSRD